MDSVLFQFHQAAGEPTLAGLVDRFGLRPEDVDPDYGVVLIDREAGLWVTTVAASAAPAIEAALTDDERRHGAGVFANPRVEPTEPGGAPGGGSPFTMGPPADPPPSGGAADPDR